MAIHQRRCLIQNAEDFYAWSKQTEESESKIKYLYYNQADVDMRNEIIQQKEKPMQISEKHHVIVMVNPQTRVHEWQEHVICRRQDEEDIDTNGTLMPILEIAAVTSDQEEVVEYERIQY
ncbi:hypothetical protein CHS0354_022505 [Potamilus streckersoni]|uniref:Uncharacterized protein n=1 Tax=Potamilus streckersoni TaxID=2493646 RepID=A0AAE0T180_9BIVA|nr:hypothetical protein CHS0354_022505 [Potamilus streckersoni]